MTKDEVFNKLNEIFRDVFDDESIIVNDSTTAKDIEGWDSLMHITLISEIEDCFNIRFAMKDVTNMKNVGDMANIILETI
ncbi:MAG: acyl carrier protein [Sphaerochaetaceae bacterium]|nr:acyl carrier protein [Sphaerochaetaceae bacterium]